MRNSGPIALAALGALVLSVSNAKAADVVVVGGASDLYRAGGSVGGDGGSDAIAIALDGATTLTFSTSGTITLNGGGNVNDADGTGAASSVSVSPLNGISGISAYQAGFLAGVFEGGSQAATPASLAYGSAAAEGAGGYSPSLQQAFFIGDGLTGDQTGATQTFAVPVGATTLYLGITDAGGYNGSPGSYGDNSGSFSVTVNGIPAGAVSAAPEPGAWALLLGGVGMLGAMMRVANARRREDEVKGIATA